MGTELFTSLKQIDPVQWNRLTEPDFPFFDYEFLSALEDSGCIGEGTAWQPRFLISKNKDGYSAALPAFRRSDSFGEFIFDWEWAHAYSNAGLSYYPKMTVAAPFTPAVGQRILTDGADVYSKQVEIFSALKSLGEDEHVSSLHVLYLDQDEQSAADEAGYLSRYSHQYHWQNHGYSVFDDYLDRLKSKRKKSIRRERREVVQSGLDIRVFEGSEITAGHIDDMYDFYLQTYSRKWGRPYLNREFFHLIRERYAEHIVLVRAERDGHALAGTINFKKGEKLYGRYWGCREFIPALHFECCFYTLIDYAIKNSIQVFEAGAQGEHKLKRGFEPELIYSSHYFYHEGGRDAIQKYLAAERRQTKSVLEYFKSRSPLKSVNEDIEEKS